MPLPSRIAHGFHIGVGLTDGGFEAFFRCLEVLFWVLVKGC